MQHNNHGFCCYLYFLVWFDHLFVLMLANEKMLPDIKRFLHCFATCTNVMHCIYYYSII